jgi:hypothetical protein
MSKTTQAKQIAAVKAQLAPIFADLSPGTSGPRIVFLAKAGITPTKYNSLKDTTKFMAKYVLNSEVPTTRNTRMWHIITFLERIGQADLANTYRSLIGPIANASKAMQEDTTMTEEEAKRYDTPITKLREILKENAPSITRSTDYNRTVADIKTLQNYVILCMYVNEPPPRNDLWELQVVSKMSDASGDGNYIVMAPRKVSLVFNRYKNSKQLGRQERVVGKETATWVRKLLLSYKDILGEMPQYLFNQINSDGTLVPISSETMSKRIVLLSKAMFGKHLSINDYRHLYEINLQKSEAYKSMTYDEKKSAHGALMHSVDTGLKYNRV